MKFIHTADIHLDSPLRGLAKYEGAPVEEIRNATRDALDNLVSLAIEESVDFIVIAGDIYDGDWKDHNTGLFFSKKMSELRRANIPVYLISGNHDADNVMTKSLVLPENVIRFSTKRPETHKIEELQVAIHAQGFANRSVTENLALNYPAPEPGWFNIGVLHTSLTGREGHDNYAPCSVADLERLEYDFWALGHVHTREEIESDCPIWFSGNIQGRHIRETGAKGCSVVSFSESGHCSVEFVTLDVVRWAQIIIDCSTLNVIDDLYKLFQTQLIDAKEGTGNRTLAVRVILNGKCPIHSELASDTSGIANQLRALASDIGSDIWLEKIVSRTTSDIGVLKKIGEDSPIGELQDVIASIRGDQTAMDELSRQFTQFIQKLPKELIDTSGLNPIGSPEHLESILEQVEPELLARIQRSEIS